MTSALDDGAGFFFWKGRVALYAILKAMGVGPGSEVLVPGFTCVVVPQAVRFAGAKPIYVDIDAATLNLDPTKIAARLTPRTKAVIVQHTFGVPADVEAITRQTGRDVRVIEDCAHTVLSTYQGRPVGTLGHAAFFSTQWSKPVTTGLGGIAVATDRELSDRLRRLAADFAMPSLRERAALFVQLQIHRRLFSPSLYWNAVALLHALSRLGIFVGSSSTEELDGAKPRGYEKRMPPFQVKALRGVLAGVASNAARRREVTRRYDQSIRSLALETVVPPTNTQPVMLRYPVLVADKAKVLEAARRARLEMGDWFVSPLHPLTANFERVGYGPGECPVAESVSRRIVNLPTHPRVDDATIVRTVEFLATMKRQGLA